MDRKKYSIFGLIFLFLSLVFLFSGISVAIFNFFGEGTTNNVIQTGKIVFSYSDSEGGGNGIYITNAAPISDDMGKILSGENEYFDFSVSATTTNSNLAYEIVVLKDDNSTLDDEYVKIYLTSIDSNTEEELPLTVTDNGVVTYSELSDTTNPLLVGKTVYYGTVKAGNVAYGKKFRLRMWVKIPEEDDFDYSLINEKTYSVKVNVAASTVY